MSARELIILGSGSQVPTRTRNQSGYFLRWDGEGILFDPGEGTQRQMVRFGVAARGITRILIIHFHGDHCLGLPGVLQRLALEPHPVEREGVVAHTGELRIEARRLEHTVEAWGYQVEQEESRTLLPERLAETGIVGGFAPLAKGPSEYLVPRSTEHLTTNLWLAERFGARVRLEGRRVRVEGIGMHA